ncbi:hypothetical protein A8B74_15535 [Sulfitobacter geojensis]|nr:hypothetical protein A8B74_15535 [Sulfitobacter geojensis]
MIANLFLVSHCNDKGHVLLQTIERDITAGSKADRSFLKFWVHVIHGAADVWMIRNNLHSVTDRSCCMSGSSRALLDKKPVEALHICQRLGGLDQAWHSGGS